MKKLWILAFAGIALASCKKDKDPVNNADPQETYEQRLVGTWNLTKIRYETEIPSFGGGAPTPVEDDATQVSGDFNINHNPNTINYNYSFIAKVPLPIIGEVEVPLDQSGNGTWTVASDNSSIYLKANEESSEMKVMENEEDRQVFRTVIPYTVPALGEIDVTAFITLQRAN